MAEYFYLDLAQTYFLLIETLKMLRARRSDECAVEVVGPGMVRAGDPFDLTFTRQKFMPAVLAHVVVCAEFAIPIAQRDDGLALNIHRHKTARLAKFFFVTQELPATMKNLFPLDLEKPRSRYNSGY